jgi:chromosome segregation protein
VKILRLELFGFKSFKDRTIVAFDQPITAIVGSNGCGKSNVVDALYWVMGDMSPKHLRGQSMTDVIFSGSRDAAPLDLAEVTMVLERDPAVDPELPPQFQSSNEIQITRRYYRSGESEYLINKIPCRLRDIQEFFMDTGVGAKAYSIIEQGAIGRMVAQKPEERRSVIEEVAGIMKFKARKAETERKIEHSKTNLQRIDDILKDLQKQLGSLKRQADKAEKFKELSEELKSLEIRMGCVEWLERSSARTAAEAEIAGLRGEQEALEAKLLELRALLDESRALLGALEGELVEARALTRQEELALKELEGERATAESRQHSLSQRRVTNESQLEELVARVAELTGQLADMEARVIELTDESNRLHTLIEETTFEVEAKRASVDDVRTRTQEARRRLHDEELGQTRLTEQIQSHQRQLAQTVSKQESLTLQIEALEQDLRVKDSERQTTLNVLESAFATRSDLEAAKNQVDEELSNLEKSRGELQIKRDALQKDNTVVRVRKEQLEALERDLAGVDAASKEMALHLRQAGVNEGLLADKIHVPATLERAVESVLGRNLQRVLVNNLAEAEDLRSVLARSESSDARQGRASLWMSAVASLKDQSLVMPDLRNLYVQADVKAPIAGEISEGFLGAGFTPPAETEIAAKNWQAAGEIPGPDGLVSYFTGLSAEPATDAVVEAPRAQTVHDFLLDHPNVIGPLERLVESDAGAPEWLPLVKGFWVVRDRDTLREVFERLEGLPMNWVTLDGDVLTQDGLLDLAPVERASGDSSVSLVQRKREIADLRVKEAELDADYKAAQESLDRCLFDIGRCKEKFRELTQRLAALNPDVENHSRFLRQVEAQLARLTEKRELLSQDLVRAGESSVELSAKIEEATTLLRESEERRAVLEGDFANLESELQAATAAQKTAEASASELQNKAKGVDRELSDERSRKAAADQERILSLARQDQLGQEIEILAQEGAELASRLEELAALVEERRTTVENLRSLESDKAREVEARKAAVEQVLDEVEAVAASREKVVGRVRDVEQSLAVNDVEIRTVSDKLQTQYQLDPSVLSAEQLQDFARPDDLEELADPQAARARALALRNRIDGLGKINMVAAEEYDDLSRRYEYLFVQRQDLSTALQQLQEAIDRIDRESRQRFADAFNAVNKAFQETFPVLFGGGNAELRLTNPDNLLETGVEIVAQPPGKKLQSVTLLSGGEKALTAVSLIFGIFSIKPSPFCVLDEVDAPLDDANVNRFNTQVRAMSDKSQIIMITHHKKSMESADALFGVTMEKPGISKIASAQLSNIDKALNTPPARL